MYVVVTTEYRGVFFGELIEENGKTVKLKDCQMCTYWSKGCHGVFGLAVKGPLTGSKIGPKVPVQTLRAVTSITQCTAEAIERWQSEPWQ